LRWQPLTDIRYPLATPTNARIISLLLVTPTTRTADIAAVIWSNGRSSGNAWFTVSMILIGSCLNMQDDFDKTNIKMILEFWNGGLRFDRASAPCQGLTNNNA